MQCFLLFLFPRFRLFFLHECPLVGEFIKILTDIFCDSIKIFIRESLGVLSEYLLLILQSLFSFFNLLYLPLSHGILNLTSK